VPLSVGQTVPPANTGPGWPVVYQPNNGFNSDNQTLDSFHLGLSNSATNLQYPNDIVVFINVTGVNSPPVITGSNFAYAKASANHVPAVSGVITNIRVSDDSLNFPLKVDIVASGFVIGITVVNSSGLTNYSEVNGNTNEVHFFGNLAQINAAFATGLQFTPKGVVGNATIIISVNDQGNSPQTGIAYTTTFNIVIDVLAPAATIPSSTVASGAVAGFISLISFSSYFLFRCMKKQQLLPQDADPWDDTAVNVMGPADNSIYALSQIPLGPQM